MNILETEWWNLALPPEWWAESEEDSILVGDRDGVGCIEISTLHRDEGDFSTEEVAQIAREEGGDGDWQVARAGDIEGLCRSIVEEDVAGIEWFAAAGPRLLYITYSCEEEHRGMDDAAVREILDTLVRTA